MMIGALLAVIITMNDCFLHVISFMSFLLRIPINYLIPFLALVPFKNYIYKVIICIIPSLFLNLFIIILLLAAIAEGL